MDALLARVGGLIAGERLPAALESADRALALAPEDRRGSPRLWGYDPLVQMRVFRSAVLSWQGRLEEGDWELERVARSARADGQLEAELSAASFRVANAELRGDAPAALEQARHVARHAERFEGTYVAVSGHGLLARAHLLGGRLDEALAECGHWEELVEAHDLGDQSMATTEHLAGVAEAKRRNGDLHGALSLAQSIVASQVASFVVAAPHWARLVSLRALLQLEGPTSQAFTQALADAERHVEETGARAFEPFLHEVRAEGAALQGDSDVRNRELREAHRLFTEMGATGHSERVARELAVVEG